MIDVEIRKAVHMFSPCSDASLSNCAPCRLAVSKALSSELINHRFVVKEGRPKSTMQLEKERCYRRALGTSRALIAPTSIATQCVKR